MNGIPRELLDKFCVAYLDNIRIYFETYKENIQSVRTVLDEKLHLCSPQQCASHHSVSFL